MSYNSLSSHIATTYSQIPYKVKKTTKYNPLIQTLRTLCWQVNPLITITTGVRGVIHEQPIKELEEKKIKIPKNEIKRLMKHLHQIAIQYHTYLIPNKRKQDNKQPPVDPPHMLCITFFLKTKVAHLPRGRKYSHGDVWSNMNSVWRNGLPFTPVYKSNPDITFILL